MANESKSHKSRLLRSLALLLAAGMLTLGFSGCKPGEDASSTPSSDNESTASTDPSSADSSSDTSTSSEGAGNEIMGEGYDVTKDTFYDKESLYVTWLNVWNGSSEFWWNGLAATTSVNGIKVQVDGEFVCFDSMKPAHRKAMVDEAKGAGIDALVMDLTNGYAGWSASAKDYQKLCYENGMKFACAVHPTDAQSVETMCQYIWTRYAGPGVAAYSSSYLYKNGKPVLVLYCTTAEFAASSAATSEYRQKFEVVWSSGENSKTDKWGWQIEPHVGPMLSGDSMFITPSTTWNSPQGSSGSWRNSLAMLDFCFLARNEAKPKYTIVGSMDDLFERNGWGIMDTTNAFYQQPLDGNPEANAQLGNGLQMRDINGNISFDAYYNRVKSWIAGEAKAYNAGGVIPDGAYTITGASSGKQFGVTRPRPGMYNDVGASFIQDTHLNSDMETYYWFYHLGNNEYRIVKLSSALSLQAGGEGQLMQQWTDAVEEQRWIVKKLGNGSYTLVNKKTGQAIAAAESDGNVIRMLNANESSADQQWKLEPVKNRIME